MSGSQLPNLVGPLTEPISGDEYVRVVLVARVDAWVAAQSGPFRLKYPPLLEWFVEDGDEQFVVLPEPERKPAPEPRRYRSAESLREELAQVQARMAQVAGAGDVQDHAVVNLSPRSRSRAAASAGRRRFAAMDRALEKYTHLRRRAECLRGRIASAEAREAKRGVL